MAQTSATCPRCHQPMTVDIQQIFDLYKDPNDKERILSGHFNVAYCPSCGYQSLAEVPVVYHDPQKELFLSYFPAALAATMDQQQKALGPLIKRVVDGLPTEMRKGYLFQPRSMLTMETMIETILEADGITKEMLRDQEKRVNLLRSLLSCSDDAISEIIQQQIDLIDQNFFALFTNVLEQAARAQDQNASQKLQKAQAYLLKETPYGRELKAMAESTQKALQDLQNLGEQLNQDTLLDLVMESPDDAYMQALVGVARNGMDYNFLSKMSERIDQAEESAKAGLNELREKLLAYIEEVDVQVQEEMKIRKMAFDEILKQDDIEKAVTQAARVIDQPFMEMVKAELDAARKTSDFERSGKIQQILDTIEKLSKMPKDIAFIESLIEAPDEAALRQLIDDNPEMINDDLKRMIDILETEASKDDQNSAQIKERISLIRSILA